MPTDLAAIERGAIRAWPAMETVAVGGWLWRFSSGGSQRANSAATLETVADPEAAIAEIERRYRERGAPVRFLITEASQPTDLDSRLAAHGYSIHEPCDVLAMAPSANVTRPDSVELSDGPTAAWLEVYLSCISADRRGMAPHIIDRIPAPRIFASARHQGQVISTALGVDCGGIVVVECVATRAGARRLGGAEAALLAIEAWARSIGAGTLALGVVAANASAKALYAGLGFVRAGGYHIRVKE